VGYGGYGAYGSRGARGVARGMSGMRGMMGNGRASGRGRGARGGRGGMMKSTYQSTTGHSVHMRGLPFSATESDVVQVICRFFSLRIFNHLHFNLFCHTSR